MHYHLPGLFEFYELYRLFLPLWRRHRDWFYEWCDIASIYGAPMDCLWGGGRAGFGQADPDGVIALMNEYGISARLTFSNSLLKKENNTLEYIDYHDDYYNDYSCYLIIIIWIIVGIFFIIIFLS